VLVGRTLTFTDDPKGVITPPLTASFRWRHGQQDLYANGNSAACGPAMPSVTLDALPQPVTVQIQCPDLTAARQIT